MVEVTACNNTTDTQTRTGERVNRFILMCVLVKKTNKQTMETKEQ